ncbi:hypothetical protein C4S76_09785 [Apibacter adventoris]|nr:hypothetical protein C4S76_09785 [Apibacter adventoris]
MLGWLNCLSSACSMFFTDSLLFREAIKGSLAKSFSLNSFHCFKILFRFNNFSIFPFSDN